MRATQSADVRLRAVSYLDRPLRHNVGVTFHTGAAEAAARLVLLDVDELPAGQSCWAQLRLAGPLAAESGDRFVVRDPNGTIGGGTIVATGAPRHRRFYLETIAALQAGASGFSLAGLVAAIRKAGATVEQIDSVLAEYHTRQPLRPGIPREELRSRVGLSSRAFDALIAALAQSGHIRVNGALVARAEFAPSLTDAERAAANAYIAALRVSPYAPAVEGAPPAAVLDFLESSGEIVRAGEVVFAADAYEAVAAAVVARLRETGAITLAEVRDMFGTSRRYAQALLERLDTTRVTKRVGDVRVLR